MADTSAKIRSCHLPRHPAKPWLPQTQAHLPHRGPPTKGHHLSLHPSLDKTYPWASFSRGARVPRKADRTLIQRESKVSTPAP